MNAGVLGEAATACAAMPAMFTDYSDEADIKPQLVRICMDCPVLGECTDFVLDVEVEGFAAGMTPKQRRRIKAKRRAA